VLSVLKSQVVLPSRKLHILILPYNKSIENTSTDFVLPEDIVQTDFEKQKIRPRRAKKFS
jgi:hypothetical protein